MGLWHLVRKLEPREQIKRAAKSHRLHTTHEVAHMVYLVGIIAERGGMHAIVGGVMLVCSAVVILGGDNDHLSN